MKKSKIWIRVCVYLLLFITLGVHSSKFDVNTVTDDISKLSILRHNIPKDYRIPVNFVPKEEGGMCWVKLNIYYLENSLELLANKFGNISSNSKDINIFIQMLQELRLKMGSLDSIMYDFECHYRKEKWETAHYFEFVKQFLIEAQHRGDSDACDPPPCPSTPHTETTQEVSSTSSPEGPVCSTPGCSTSTEQRSISEMVERSLLSLLLIPLLAIVFLIVWKIRSRRNNEEPQQDPAGGLYSDPEWTEPPLDETTEKNKLNVIATV